MSQPTPLCRVCKRPAVDLCDPCRANLERGLSPLRTRELGALRLVREVRP